MYTTSNHKVHNTLRNPHVGPTPCESVCVHIFIVNQNSKTEPTCATGSCNRVLNNHMRRQLLLPQLGIEKPVSLFLERVGEAQGLIELRPQHGFRPQPRLDDQQPPIELVGRRRRILASLQKQRRRVRERRRERGEGRVWRGGVRWVYGEFERWG